MAITVGTWTDPSTLEAVVGEDLEAANYNKMLGNINAGTGVLFVAAPSMTALGAASLALRASTGGTYLTCADAASDGGAGWVLIPPGWVTADVILWWSQGTSASGNVVWESYPLVVGNTSTITMPSATTNTIAAPGTAHVVKKSTLNSGFSVTAGSMLQVSARRAGADGSDTLAATASLIGIEVRRAS